MKLYFVAGEVSGDTHGAALIEALQSQIPGAEFFGAGGPQMQAGSGGNITDWTGEAAVVGLWEVLRKYGYFKERFDAMLLQIQNLQPDAVVLIDYPGFNLRLAKALRERGLRAKLIYYISPQVWAWNRGRIPKMAKWLDLMLCIFPFEKELYVKSGLRTVFVGHPMIESLARKREGLSREADLIGLFPGSRGREIRKHFPILLETLKWLQAKDPKLQFEAAAASEKLAVEMRAHCEAAGVSESACPISVGGSHSLMQRAAAGIVASGTATMESAFFGMPLVILYKVAWLTYLAGRALIRVPFLGMINLLSDREIAVECIQDRACPEIIGAEIMRLLNDAEWRAEQERSLSEVIAKLGGSGASGRAAVAIVGELKK